MGTIGESYLEFHPCWHYRQGWEGMESPGVSGADTSKEIWQLQDEKGLVLSRGDRGRKGDWGKAAIETCNVSQGAYFVTTAL